jgi:hypothetical protein
MAAFFQSDRRVGLSPSLSTVSLGDMDQSASDQSARPENGSGKIFKDVNVSCMAGRGSPIGLGIGKRRWVGKLSVYGG